MATRDKVVQLNHEAVEKIQQYATSAEAEAERKKLRLPKPPEPDPIRDDHTGEIISIFQKWSQLRKRHGGVANIPYHELADYLDQWAELLAYVRFQEAIQDIDCGAYMEIRDRLYDQVYISEDGGRELRAALAGAHELYVEYSKKFTEAQVALKLTQSLRQSYEYRYYAVSREISRRQGDMSQTKRSQGR